MPCRTESSSNPVRANAFGSTASSVWSGDAEAEFTMDGEIVRAGPGTWVTAPVGVEHGFRVAGDDDLVMLNIHGPNTGFGLRLREN